MKVLKEVKRTDPINSKMILQQAYENTFGIFDYITQALNENALQEVTVKRPLASVSLHPAEEFGESSRLYEVIKIYSLVKVHDYYRLSLIEFLELPHDIVDFIIEDCSKRENAEAKRTNQVVDELKNGIKN